VVNIVMVGTSPDGEEMMKRPWELISGVRIDSLEKAENDPEVHGEDMKVASQPAEQDWGANSSESENHDFNRRGVLGSESEWSRVLMVDLVDVLVEEWLVHGAVSPIVPGILHDKKESDLPSHLEEWRERHTDIHSESGCHRVEEPDLREFDGEMGEENKFGAVPLFFPGRDFSLRDVRFQVKIQ
jgi:hypothetical protein